MLDYKYKKRTTMTKFRELFEGTGWKLVKSTKSGPNKGVEILSFKDGADYMEIARTAKDEYTIATEYNDGGSGGSDYEYNLKDFDAEYYQRNKAEMTNLPKFPLKKLKNLEILKDKEDDWGTI